MSVTDQHVQGWEGKKGDSCLDVRYILERLHVCCVAYGVVTRSVDGPGQEQACADIIEIMCGYFDLLTKLVPHGPAEDDPRLMKSCPLYKEVKTLFDDWTDQLKRRVTSLPALPAPDDPPPLALPLADGDHPLQPAMTQLEPRALSEAEDKAQELRIYSKDTGVLPLSAAGMHPKQVADALVALNVALLSRSSSLEEQQLAACSNHYQQRAATAWMVQQCYLDALLPSFSAVRLILQHQSGAVDPLVLTICRVIGQEDALANRFTLPPLQSIKPNLGISTLTLQQHPDLLHRHALFNSIEHVRLFFKSPDGLTTLTTLLRGHAAHLEVAAGKLAHGTAAAVQLSICLAWMPLKPEWPQVNLRARVRAISVRCDSPLTICKRDVRCVCRSSTVCSTRRAVIWSRCSARVRSSAAPCTCWSMLPPPRPPCSGST